MQIFFPCSKAATDMAFRLVHFQNCTDGFCQLGVDAFYSVGDVLMHCAFADPELLRRFPYRGIGMDHEIRNLDRPFLDICLQTKHSSKYRLVMYMLRLGQICLPSIRLYIMYKPMNIHNMFVYPNILFEKSPKYCLLFIYMPSFFSIYLAILPKILYYTYSLYIF